MNAFRHPSPGEDDITNNSSLVLTAKQFIVYDLIGHFMDGKLSDIYKGAHEVLKKKGTDYEALSAHGFREVIDRSGFWYGGDNLPDMKTHFNNEIRNKHENHFKLHAPEFESAKPKKIKSLDSVVTR